MTDASPAPTRRRPVLLAWSGGKDAAWTLHVLRQRADVDVVALLTTVTTDEAHIAVHGIRRDILLAQAAATGLPVIEASVEPGCGNAEYEAALASALDRARARWPDLDTVASGDLALADVRAWREASLARLGWHLTTPLFGADTARLARTMIDAGLRAWLCCVDTRQLDARFAGRAFDAALLAALPAGCDPCGENGEFHTLVVDGPMFAAPLQLRAGAQALRDGRFLQVDAALT